MAEAQDFLVLGLQKYFREATDWLTVFCVNWPDIDSKFTTITLWIFASFRMLFQMLISQRNSSSFIINADIRFSILVV